jgi:hypothetical protein
LGSILKIEGVRDPGDQTQLTPKLPKLKCQIVTLRTHSAFVCAGPDRELVINREKYSGIDKPRKSETPTMKRLRIEFILVNCRKDKPTAAGDKRKKKISCTI